MKTGKNILKKMLGKLSGCVIGSAVLLSSFLLHSCNDDEGYPMGALAYDWVTVNVSNHTYSFTGDEWGTLYPAAGGLWVEPVDGQRAFLWFSPIGDNYGGYDHAIKPEAIRYFLTKGVEEITSVEDDEEYGNHPVYLEDLWISGGHLNVLFNQKLPVDGNKHRVSLVKNELAENPDDGYIHLEYRYNTYGDTLSNVMVPGVVCYNLSTLNIGSASKGIKLKVNDAVKGPRTITFDAEEQETFPAGMEEKDFTRCVIK